MQILAAFAAVVLLSIVSSLGVHHYYATQEEPGVAPNDTAIIAQVDKAVEQVTNPVMLSVDEVLDFRQCTIDQKTCDSTFNLIPYEVLRNVAQVVIGRQGSTTKQDIVYEYNRNYNEIYKYIKPTVQPQNNKEDTTQIRGVSSGGSDTIINGKRFKKVE